MDYRAIQRIKEDFGSWSGGFPPESPDQITVYVDYALDLGIDPNDARRMLLDWMNAIESNDDILEKGNPSPTKSSPFHGGADSVTSG